MGNAGNRVMQVMEVMWEMQVTDLEVMWVMQVRWV